MNPIKILVAVKIVIRNKLHTKDWNFCSCLWTSLLADALCSVPVGWCTFLYARKYIAIIMLNILCAVTQNLVTRATNTSGFVPFCPNAQYVLSTRARNWLCSHPAYMLKFRFNISLTFHISVYQVISSFRVFCLKLSVHV